MMVRELLDTILENQEVFERYTRVQDKLGKFLIDEKERRENAKISYDTAVKAEELRQSEAFDIMVMMATSKQVSSVGISNELIKEKEIREMKAKEIAEIATLEAERRSNAARIFGKLFVERYSLGEFSCSSDFSRKYTPSV